MPSPPEYLDQINDVILLLRGNGFVLTRKEVEELLHTSRRQAIRIMQTAGGEMSGKCLTIKGDLLVRFLEIQGEKYGRVEEDRRARISEKLNEAAAEPKCVVPLTPAQVKRLYPTRLDNLPDGVDLKPGLLQVEYTSLRDFAEKLVGLSVALGHAQWFTELFEDVA